MSITVILNWLILSVVFCYGIIVFYLKKNTLLDNKDSTKYEKMIELSPQPIVIHKDGLIHYMNQSALKLLEVKDLKAVKQMSLINFVPIDVRKIVTNRMQEMLKQNSLDFPVETKVITNLGKIIDVEVKGIVVHQADPKEIQFVLQDITERKNNEKKLKENNKAIENILKSISDAFFSVDKNWKLSYLNPSAEKLFKKNMGNLIGQNIFELYPKMKELKYYDYYHKAIKEQISVRFEEFSPTLNKWVEVTAHPLTEGLSIFFNDITARKKIEQIQKQSNDRLKRILETVPNGIVIVEPNCKVAYANLLAEQIFRFKSEEHIREHFINQKKHDKTIKVGPFLNQQVPINLVLKSGTTIHNVEMIVQNELEEPVIVSVNAAPLYNAIGEITEIILSINNITPIKKQELELKEKTQKLEAIFANSAIGILLFDIEGKLLESNPMLNEILGYSDFELKEKAEQYFIQNDIVNDKSMRKLLNDEINYFQVDKRLRHKAGNGKWTRVTVSRVEKSESKPQHLICVIEDITKTKEAEISNLLKDAELRLLQAQINPHFLFNTLNSIITLIRINPDIAKHITIQLANYMRMTLNLSDIDLIPLSTEIEHISAYLEIIKIRFQDQMKVQIEYSVDDNFDGILIPPFTLQPLIQNSIVHGLRGRPYGGEILIRASKQNEGAVVYVEDNGTGINPSKMDSLGKEKIESHDGNGLGVYNVNQRLVMLLGDKAGLHISNKEQGGTLVHFSLPKKERVKI